MLSVARRSAIPGRDLRLDFFRGLALWLVFLDHIPSNVVSWITIRNYGLSDASEIFIFISGYTASLVYGRAMQQHGFVIAAARILRRCWQIYVAHLFLFVFYIAEITNAASRFHEPLFAEETHVLAFLQHPDATIVQALLLKFKPVNLDVLPIYILFLLAFPAVLWLLRRNLALPLAASAVLYALTWMFQWNLPAYPAGEWFFNPFAWQLLFVFGAWCAAGGAEYLQALMRSRITVVLAVSYLLFGFLLAGSWHWHWMVRIEPDWLIRLVVAHPIDKTNLHALRLLHFLALALLVLRVFPRHWPVLTSPALRPAIVCGRHSLETFCLGTFLAFAGHFAIVEIAHGIGAQIVISSLGIALMVGLAGLIDWYQATEASARHAPPGVAPANPRRERPARSVAMVLFHRIRKTAGASSRSRTMNIRLGIPNYSAALSRFAGRPFSSRDRR